MSEISKRILAAIEKKGITYAELAEKTGIPKTALHRYATGDTEKIPTSRIPLLAKALDVSIGYLTGWEEEAPAEPTPEYYESIGVAARMRPQLRQETPVTLDSMISQMQSLQRQLADQVKYTPQEQRLVNMFRELPRSMQSKVITYMNGLLDRLEGSYR